MILLDEEDLASLNDDRLTALLPGHWVYFFSHFHFDVMEQPGQDRGRPLPPVRNPSGGPFRPRDAARPLLLRTARGPARGAAPESGEEDGNEDAPLQEEPRGQTLQQEFLSRIPADQILSSLLAHLSVAQIRAVILHFFRGLLFWKNALAVAALLVMLKARQRLPLPPAHALELARPPAGRSLRLVLDPALLASRGVASAFAWLLPHVPRLLGARVVPSGERARRGVLRLTPQLWMRLCERLGVRVTLGGGARPPTRGRRALELHVVGGGAVLRDALQDDLQRYRQSGLHDGLQDTSQDAQGDDVQAGPAALGLLHARLRGTLGRPAPPLQERAARALARFLALICAEASGPSGEGRPSEGAQLQELPDEDADMGGR